MYMMLRENIVYRIRLGVSVSVSVCYFGLFFSLFPSLDRVPVPFLFRRSPINMSMGIVILSSFSRPCYEASSDVCLDLSGCSRAKDAVLCVDMKYEIQ